MWNSSTCRQGKVPTVLAAAESFLPPNDLTSLLRAVDPNKARLSTRYRTPKLLFRENARVMVVGFGIALLGICVTDSGPLASKERICSKSQPRQPKLKQATGAMH